MTSASCEACAFTIHLVEDDASVRAATARLLGAAGYDVQTYGSAAEFFSSPRPNGFGCAVLDLQLPGPSGLDIQQALVEADDPMPVVFLTGHGCVSESVQAMKAGAVDFLTKSDECTALLDAVARAFARAADGESQRARRLEIEARYSRLSPRERDVFAHLISGQLNKQVGFDLGISEQTTKIHRHRVFEKMEADSIVHLARMAAELGIAPVGRVR